VAGCCECGDETSVSVATELVNSLVVGYQLFVVCILTTFRRNVSLSYSLQINYQYEYECGGRTRLPIYRNHFLIYCVPICFILPVVPYL
jgi:hypothetical protein